MTLRGLYPYGIALTHPVTVLHAKPACTRPQLWIFDSTRLNSIHQL